MSGADENDRLPDGRQLFRIDLRTLRVNRYMRQNRELMRRWAPYLDAIRSKRSR